LLCRLLKRSLTAFSPCRRSGSALPRAISSSKCPALCLEGAGRETRAIRRFGSGSICHIATRQHLPAALQSRPARGYGLAVVSIDVWQLFWWPQSPGREQQQPDSGLPAGLLHELLDRAGGSSFASALRPWFLLVAGVYCCNGSVFGFDWSELSVHIAADPRLFTSAPGRLLRQATVAVASRGCLITSCVSSSLLDAVEGHISSL
jgi:hypothetical protein